MKEIQIYYYAMLKEQRGLSQETIQTKAATAAELYQTLQTQHKFTIAPTSLRVAVNHAFTDWQGPIQSGDIITFIPPVAGG